MTSADVLAINSSEEIVGIITQLESVFPELRLFAAGAVAKTSYKTLVKTAAATAGFRGINEGLARNRATRVVRNVDCKYVDASWDIDDAAVSAVEWGDPFAMETEDSIEAQMAAVCTQIWYGLAADAKGFMGVGTLLATTDHPMVVDAGGSTVAGGTSLFAVRSNERAAALVWGKDGRIEAGEVKEQQLYDDENKPYMGNFRKIAGYAGLQLTDYTCVGRIANMTDEDGCGLTDDRVATLLETFPSGKGPDFMITSKKAVGQLRASRTTFNATGAPAPYPTDAFGVLMFDSSAISVAEAILTASVGDEGTT